MYSPSVEDVVEFELLKTSATANRVSPGHRGFKFSSMADG